MKKIISVLLASILCVTTASAMTSAKYTILNQTKYTLTLANLSTTVPDGLGHYVRSPARQLAPGAKTSIQINFKRVPLRTAPYGYTVYQYKERNQITYCGIYGFGAKFKWKNMGHCWVTNKKGALKIKVQDSNGTFILKNA